MAFISNGTTVASGGSLQNVPAPTNAQIASGVAAVSADAVGSYACIYHKTISTQYGIGSTRAMNGANDWEFSTASVSEGSPSGSNYPDGTWRCMGSSVQGRTGIWLRIS